MNEQELFNMIKDEYYPDLTMVVDEYSNFDCVSEREDLYIELKCRGAHYDDLLIEKYKYDKVIEQANITGKTPVYICSTPSGVWEFNLDTIKIIWEDKENLPKTTEFENTEKVVKTVGFLPISKGKKLFHDFYADDVDEEMEKFSVYRNDDLFLDEELESVIQMETIPQAQGHQ